MAKKKKDINKHRDYRFLREYKAGFPTLELLDRYAAHSVGIGRKIVGGKVTNQLALRVYVAKKRLAAELSSEEAIPKSMRFYSQNSEKESRLNTDVIETPPAQIEQINPKTNIRPVPGGVSGGFAATGTVGGWVWDNTDDTIVMLSNDHVFGHTPASDIIQRGSFDGGSTPADKIGDVKRGIARSSVTPNTVDCAIGDPDSSDIHDLTVVDIGPAVYAIEVPILDMLVEKYGRTTRHTFGEIQDTDWSGTVSGLPFEDCLYVDIVPPSDDWSMGGDSGSLVFSQTPISENSDIKPVVGLHFAGGGTHGIECKIQNVFNSLDLTTLCAGAFAAFLDALFEAESEGMVSEEAETQLRAISALAMRTPMRVIPLPFVKRERRKYRARSFYSGISRDMQKRLMANKRGRLLTDFVDNNRAELLTLLTKDRDIRRATVAALRPLLVGVTTTTDVLERRLTAEDLKRLDKLAREVSRKSGSKLKLALKVFQQFRLGVEGKSLANILRIKL